MAAVPVAAQVVGPILGGAAIDAAPQSPEPGCTLGRAGACESGFAYTTFVFAVCFALLAAAALSALPRRANAAGPPFAPTPNVDALDAAAAGKTSSPLLAGSFYTPQEEA